MNASFEKKILVISSDTEFVEDINITFGDEYDINVNNTISSAYDVLAFDSFYSIIFVKIERKYINDYLHFLNGIHKINNKLASPIMFFGDKKCESYVNSFINAGANDFIYLPTDFAALKNRINNLVEIIDRTSILIQNRTRYYEDIQKQMKALFENLDDGICVMELENPLRFLYINDNYQKMMKLNVDKIDDVTPLFNMMHKEDAKRIEKLIRESSKEKVDFKTSYEIIVDGNVKHHSIKGMPLMNKVHGNDLVLFFINDITQLYSTQEELNKTSEKLQILMDNVPGGVAIYNLDLNFTCLYANEGAFRIFGFEKNDFNNLTLLDGINILGLDGLDKLYSSYKFDIRVNNVWEYKFKAKKKYGTEGWFLIRGKRVSDEKGKPQLFVVISDITRSVEQEKKLSFYANHDEVSGIFNKKRFNEEAMKLMLLYPKEEYALVCFSIHNFKSYTDIFGLKFADEIIASIGEYLHSTQVEHELYGRLSNDVFGIFMRNSEFKPDYFISNINNVINQKANSFNIKIDCGIYIIKDPNILIEKAYEMAYYALSKLSSSNGGQYQYFNEDIKVQIIKKQNILNEMQNALKEKQMYILIQPIYNIETNTIASGEALVRWNHERYGRISPGEFIPIFEENGYIVELDKYVLEETCRKIRGWLDKGINVVPISVNFSRFTIYSLDFIDTINHILDRYNLDHKYIRIEITETIYAISERQIMEIVNQLHENGYVVLMDDFGSGYSSLNMLKNLPVDTLKIDMNFMENFNQSKRSWNILISIIAMARRLDLPVIIEGVETQEQKGYLQTIGCRYIQGYYFSKPIEVEKFEKMLKNN